VEGSEPQAGQAVPGWYANPQGPGQRYWDGAQWTEQYQPSPGGAAPPPPKKQRNWLKGCVLVGLGICLAAGALIVGCTALIGAGVDEAEKEQNKKGITLSEFRNIKQGATQDDVEAKLGPPEDSQEFEQQIPELQGQPSRSSCIYYPEKNKPLFEGRSFQLCFDEGKLTAKNAY
jgi:hypothetical protein